MKQLEDLLKEMCERKASDLLLTVGAAPQLRINGLLVPANHPSMDGAVIERIAYHVLGDQRMEALMARKSVDFSKGYEGLSRFRFNFYYQRDSIAAAIRVIPFKIPPFEELGIPEVVKEFALRPHGLVLITGPAGSGKSTTMAAMLDYINDNRRLHMVCLEDPIEYLHHHKLSVIDQREIGEDAHSFSEALHSVFRQSPDVIMVGEMRDLETIRLALTAAETGHLVFGTLHTSSAAKTIDRIIDVFPAAEKDMIRSMLSESLQAVISQTLMKKIGGGRVAAHEIMVGTSAIRNLIREAKVAQMYSAIQTGRKDGMQTLDQNLKELVDKRLITSATAASKAVDRTMFR